MSWILRLVLKLAHVLRLESNITYRLKKKVISSCIHIIYLGRDPTILYIVRGPALFLYKKLFSTLEYVTFQSYDNNFTRRVKVTIKCNSYRLLIIFFIFLKYESIFYQFDKYLWTIIFIYWLMRWDEMRLWLMFGMVDFGNFIFLGGKWEYRGTRGVIWWVCYKGTKYGCGFICVTWEICSIFCGI